MKFLLCLLISLFGYFGKAQAPKAYHSGEVRKMLEKLNVLGTVLYVAAHPDDENTRLITYFANNEYIRTGYLSATRGDGGQNLIGSEIGKDLGIIRTHELLAARKVDGGEQFFSRANDFGYSKHPDETFNIWNRQEVLSDFVWIFRRFKPDVIITRFNMQAGTTHGHHTASAMLAMEAFNKSGDKTAFPEQLEHVTSWQPSKIFWNTSWWFYRSSGQTMDTSNTLQVNVGKYDPLLGKSYTEIAAQSRSMHKSQGFGSSGKRGDEIEYLIQWDGKKGNTVFDGINISWSRIKGSEEVAFFINKAIEIYDERNPTAIIDPLIVAKAALQKLDDPIWAHKKSKEIDEIILATTGLYLSLSVKDDYLTPGDSVGVSFEAINRSSVTMVLESMKVNIQSKVVHFNTSLLENKQFENQFELIIPNENTFNIPYWLHQKGSFGMYQVAQQLLRGSPKNAPPLTAEISIDLNGSKINFEVPILFKYTDPVEGEVHSPVVIGPPATVNLSDKVLVFGDDQSKKIEVRVAAGKHHVEGKVALNPPEGWKISPKEQSFSFSQKGEEKNFTFNIVPPSKPSVGEISAKILLSVNEYPYSKVTINYDHIPKQQYFSVQTSKLVKINLKKKGSLIGYVEGAGDAIPSSLRQLGYQVNMLSVDDITLENLKQYDAVILGVRAFNTVKWLSFKNKVLFEYVKEGGNVIVQYNTSHRLVTNEIAPYDLSLSRDRVTVEEAPVKMLAPTHPVLNSPNKITKADFEGWVQERGLYFPNQWSDEFIPILSSNDPEESPKNGGLLVAKYGKGYYVYTGYSWFRELPAGVSGAYRLFVNLISLGK